VYVNGVYADSAFKLSGSAKVTGNRKGAAANNVYLSKGKPVTVTGELTGGKGCIGVTAEKSGVFTSGLANGGTDALACFAGDAPDSFMELNEGGEATLGVPSFRVEGSVVKVSAPKGATLLCTAYESSGKMVSARTKTLDTAGCVDATLAELKINVTPPSGGYYKLFLLGGDYAPLCAAWDSTTSPG